MLKRVAEFIAIIFLFAALVPAQVCVNSMEVTDSSGNVTDPTQEIHTNVGASLYLTNEGPVGAVLSVWKQIDGEWVKQGEIGLANPSSQNVEHGLSEGSYLLRVKEAGTDDSTAEDVGTLVVH